MRLFLTKVGLMLVVVVSFLWWLEVRARRTDSDVLAIQRDYLQDHAQEIEGLIFGSSHMKRALNPAGLRYPTATLALSAGSLRTAIDLFEQVRQQTQPHFVIIELSAGYLDSWNFDEWQQQRKLYYYFGVPQSRMKLRDLFILRQPLRHQLFPEPVAARYNEFGFPLNLTDGKNDFAQARYNPDTIATYRSTRRKIKQHNRALYPEARVINEARLLELIDYCGEHQIEIILLSAPKYYFYNTFIRQEHLDNRAAFLDLVADQPHVHFWNMETWADRDPTLFYNVTHLNQTGAAHFTAHIDSRLHHLLEDK